MDTPEGCGEWGERRLAGAKSWRTSSHWGAAIKMNAEEPFLDLF